MNTPSVGTSGASTDSGAYTDLNRLSSLKTGDRDSDGNLKKVAQEFESLFLGQMLKSMRSANEVLAKDNPLNSAATKQYQDMYDQQMSVSLSHKGNGIGLQEVLMRQLSKNKSSTAAPAVAAPATTTTPAAAAGNNPFARPVAAAHTALGATRNVSTDVRHMLKQADGMDPARNDMAKMNLRRLSLPSKVTDRVMAGVAGTSATASAAAGVAASQKSGVISKIHGPVVNGASYAGATSDVSTFNDDWTSMYAASASAADASKTASNKVASSDGLRVGRSMAQPPLAPGKKAFASADEFITTMLPMAQEAAARIGVDPKVLVAQAALETGFGKSIMRTADGSSSHNLFNIKASSNWKGPQARAITSEYENGKMVKETADFRSYSSYQDSFHDLVDLLQNNDRYQKVVKSAENPEQFVKELQKAGYATDPHYATKISHIAAQMKGYENYATNGSSSNL